MGGRGGVKIATWGEAQGPDPVNKYHYLATPTADTISNTDVRTAFASVASVTGGSVGDAYILRAAGVYGTGGVGVQLQIEVTVSGTTVLDTGSILTSPSLTDRGWSIDAVLVAKTATTCECQGAATLSTSVSAASIRDMENTGDVAVDLISGTIQIIVTWGAADASNTITLRRFLLTRQTA